MTKMAVREDLKDDVFYIMRDVEISGALQRLAVEKGKFIVEDISTFNQVETLAIYRKVVAIDTNITVDLTYYFREVQVIDQSTMRGPRRHRSFGGYLGSSNNSSANDNENCPCNDCLESRGEFVPEPKVIRGFVLEYVECQSLVDGKVKYSNNYFVACDNTNISLPTDGQLHNEYTSINELLGLPGHPTYFDRGLRFIDDISDGLTDKALKKLIKRHWEQYIIRQQAGDSSDIRMAERTDWRYPITTTFNAWLTGGAIMLRQLNCEIAELSATDAIVDVVKTKYSRIIGTPLLQTQYQSKARLVEVTESIKNEVYYK